jgi:hypothetical protein
MGSSFSLKSVKEKTWKNDVETYFREECWAVCTGFFWLRTRTVAACCEVLVP